MKSSARWNGWASLRQFNIRFRFGRLGNYTLWCRAKLLTKCRHHRFKMVVIGILRRIDLVPEESHWSLGAPGVEGSHTSKLISESVDGLAIPCTRRRGAVTLVVPMVSAAATGVVEVIVADSEATPSNAEQRLVLLSPSVVAVRGR